MNTRAKALSPWKLVPLLAVLGTAMLALLGATAADPPAAPAPDAAARDLHTKFRTERADAQGLTKKFSPDWYQRADADAKRGDEALTAGRFVEAADAFRKARWNLPGLPAGLPDHVARLFGDGRLRHGQVVQAVAFSADGRRIVSASADGAVIVWDADTGRALRRYTGHADRVWCLAFSPDGKTVASGGEDKAIKIWDADTGKDVQSLTGHTDLLRCLAYSPDGKYLATGGQDKYLRVYDLSNGSIKQGPLSHTQAIVGVAWSRDGKLLASVGGADDRTVRI